MLRDIMPAAAFAAEDHGFGMVAIAASAGGLAALGSLAACLPTDFPAPILLCQHVGRGRISLLPEILGRKTALRVQAAQAGEHPQAGIIYVASPDRHMLLLPDGRIALPQSEPVNYCRPSADVLFRSVAEVCGARAIGVVLTGRGRDGALGIAAIRRQGGFTIAQDEASSEAFEMPLAARDIGHADLVLPLGRIAEALLVLTAPAAPGSRLERGSTEAAGLPLRTE